MEACKEKALAFEVFDAMGVTLTPAQRAAVEQRPTREPSALVAFSRGNAARAGPAAHGRLPVRSEFRDATEAQVAGSSGTSLDARMAATIGRAGRAGLVLTIDGVLDSGLDVDNTAATRRHRRG